MRFNSIFEILWTDFSTYVYLYVGDYLDVENYDVMSYLFICLIIGVRNISMHKKRQSVMSWLFWFVLRYSLLFSYVAL